MRSAPEDNFPGPIMLGAVVDDPSLSQAEWEEVQARCGLSLDPEVREQIDVALFWCKLERLNRDQLPRIADVKRRLKEFVRGGEAALNALGYLDAAGIGSASERAPINTQLRDGHAGATWLALVTAATSSGWDGSYWTQRALGGISQADDLLRGLHALVFTASEALKAWPTDRGGRKAGGDAEFIRRLLRTMQRAGVDTAPQHDRISDEMAGPVWNLLVELWSRRSTAFTAGEYSTLGRYYRQAHQALKETTVAD